MRKICFFVLSSCSQFYFSVKGIQISTAMDIISHFISVSISCHDKMSTHLSLVSLFHIKIYKNALILSMNACGK